MSAQTHTGGPMFDNIFFFVYILAIFAGLLSAIFAILLIRYWHNGNGKMLGALLSFEICNVVISAMYFIYYFMSISLMPYYSGPVLRVIDMWMYIGQTLAWAVYVQEKGHVAVVKSRRLRTAAVIAMLAVSFVVYGFMMDGYYYAGKYFIPAALAETMLMITFILIITVYTYKALQSILLKKIRYLIIAIAALTMINQLWNMLLSITLMKGIDLIVDNPNADMTPVMILVMSVLILILLTCEDFSSLFAGTGQGPYPSADYHDRRDLDDQGSNITDGSAAGDGYISNDIETRLNIIAVEHLLTQREREVLGCAYHGMTNPQISERLNISQSTVKRHMHNIFEKTDVKTRVELIHMVNNWTDMRS